MRINRQHECESLWPTYTQELLLRAAMCDGPEAQEALAAWKKATGFAQYSDVDFLSTNLLPGVYGKLARSGISDAWLPQMAGLHRYHWAQNAARQRILLEVIERFQSERLRFVILGSFALLAGKYLGDLGQRPLLGAEILLAPSDAAAARRAFVSLGWRAAAGSPPPVAGWRPEKWLGPDDQALQVKFRWLPKPYPVVGIDRLFRHATLADVGGLPVPIPDAADLLLHACVCSRLVHEDIRRQFLWVADAILILQQRGANLDWDRLWQESRPLCTLFPLRDALEYLRTTFECPVSETWLAETRQVSIPPDEMRPFFQSTRQLLEVSKGPAIVNRPWHGYVAAEQAAGRVPSAGGLFRYFAWRASVEFRKATHFGSKASSRQADLVRSRFMPREASER